MSTMKRKTNSTAPVLSAAAVAVAVAVACLLMASTRNTGTNAFSPIRSPNARMRSIHTVSNTRYAPMTLPSRSHAVATTSMKMSQSDFDLPQEDDNSNTNTNSNTNSNSDTILPDTESPSNTDSQRQRQRQRDDTLKKRGTQAVAAALAMSLAFLPVSDANAAATGGRMGGSFQSSPSRQTISRPSSRTTTTRSYTTRSYAPRPSVTIAPSVGFGYGTTPYFSPYASPFMGPRFYGGAGVMTVTRGPSFFDLLFFGGLLFAVATIFRQNQANAHDDTWTNTYESRSPLPWGSPWGSPFSSSFSSSSDVLSSALGPGTSVVQLSVALEVSDRDDRNSILSVLDRLSQTARTDNRVGIQNLSSQVALEILRRRSSIVSASSSTKHYNSRDKALREFQNRSIKERSKFENETVNKYGGVDYSSSPSSLLKGGESGPSDRATMAVITLVLAIDGDSTKLNKIKSMSDVEQSLQKIASDSKVSDCLQSAEILWTPEDRGETLGIRDVTADYPELRSV